MRAMIGVTAFAVLLVILGVTGESDRRTAEEYAPVRVEIYASAPEWAVRE